MDFGISQEGCFDRALIVQRAVPASRTGNTALPCRMSPTFSFCLAKKKCAGHGTKEKALRDELPGKAVNSPKTGAGRHELPTELETPLPAALYLNLKSVRRRICGHGAQRGANRTSLAPLSAAAPPSPRGVSKGEKPQFRPFVPRGGMGDGWRPPCFGWGSKGEGPLRQRPLPLAP